MTNKISGCGRFKFNVSNVANRVRLAYTYYKKWEQIIDLEIN
jgi:hypothetical protein